MAVVTIENISKRYPRSDLLAVDSVDLVVNDGEFMVLLGPSGCGKSTLLRMVAGLESITSGTLRIDNEVMNQIQAKDRDIAMVFQSYALYPHMRVHENLAFGLKRRAIPKDEITKRVDQAARMLGLEDLLNRKPHALSGGQRQRVALGRAIVRDPKVFLFDEPLSNLDAALRVDMRNELVALHQRLKATMIYVTHDQVEAMTMGDRICVMKNGRLIQEGPPMEVYGAPATTFVAQFLGSPPMNLIPADVASGSNGEPMLRLGANPLPSRPQWSALLLSGGPTVTFGIRPEDIFGPGRTPPPAAEIAEIQATVSAVEVLGAETIIIVQVDGATPGKCTARLGRNTNARIGDRIVLQFDMSAAHLFDPATEHLLMSA